MKYGKTLLETLESVPEEWRQQAIEYRKLKKVINRVASELQDLGLTSEVLKELLAQPGTVSSPPKSPALPLSPVASTSNLSADDDEKNSGTETRIEQVIDEAEGTLETEEDDAPELSEKAKGKRKAPRTRKVRATYELAGTSANPEPRIHLVFSSCSSESYSESDTEPSDAQRVSSDDERDDASSASPANFLFKRHARSRSNTVKGQRKSPKARITEIQSESESDAGQTPPSKEGSSSDPSGGPDSFPTTASTSSVAEDAEPPSNVEFEGAGPHANNLLKRMYGVGRWSDDEDSPSVYELEPAEAQELAAAAAAEDELGAAAPPADSGALSQRLKRAVSQETLRAGPLTPTSLAALEKEDYFAAPATPKQKFSPMPRVAAVEEADEADDEREKVPSSAGTGRRRKHRPRQHRREVFIPLNSDTEFLTLLASALNSLATLQLAQKRQFTESVQLLAREVSAVSSPSRPKTDLYIWREIFSLWVEAAIFESSRERDRGERSIEDVEKKLEWFVDQVAKRKLAKRMRHKESRVALEKFIALNVELLDLKKFQIANEEAARKILKKHDKRTALTASARFPKFIASEDATSMISTELIRSNDDGTQRPVLTLPGFPSLPHVLLSTFTTTLLPIIPSLEDYECSICGDVAFKPIRLNCGHKFCVRCLVKMQKRGQDNCPQCRSAVVLRANATNLDTELQQFMQRWFPHEVKAKEKANRKEAAREELEEMGLVEHKCLVM
ncbi:hypothetical protein Rhopal_006306-T1 [Rhodotorula paludigena]|uniref:SPX domain-containing protein n=1 Tax=Rhodotorula paludigena TaxID=86838 RepID=A0AAV5GVL8_9BASI|nr:hypothetical protein Rhopal_006306-T1 [Rhodotorula paludigena]